MADTTPQPYKVRKWIPWAAFLLVGVPLMVWGLMNPDPEKAVAESFAEAMENQAYEEAFEYLSDDAQQRYETPASLEANLPLDEWIFYMRDDGDRSSDALDASARVNGGDRTNLRIYLVQDENQEWRVDSISGLP